MALNYCIAISCYPGRALHLHKFCLFGAADMINAMALGLLTRRWRREFNKAVKLPSRDTIFDYFLSIENGECRFEPWTKHKIFKVIDFDSNKMQMNEVFQLRPVWFLLRERSTPPAMLNLKNSKKACYHHDLVRGVFESSGVEYWSQFSCRCTHLLQCTYYRDFDSPPCFTSAQPRAIVIR